MFTIDHNLLRYQVIGIIPAKFRHTLSINDMPNDMPTTILTTDGTSTIEEQITFSKRKYEETDFHKSIEIAEAAERFAKNTIERLKVAQLKAQSLVALNALTQVTEVTQKALDIVGFTFETQPPTVQTSDLSKLPFMSEEDKTVLYLIKLTGEAAYMINPELCYKAIWSEYTYCIKHGISSLAAVAFCDYGFFLCASGKIEEGHKLGQHALYLLNKFCYSEFKTTILELFYCNINHWASSAHDAIIPLEEAFLDGIKNKEFLFAGIAAVGRCDSLFFCGKNLKRIEQEYQRYFNAFELMGIDYPCLYGSATRHLCLSLQGKPSKLDFDALKGNQTALLAAYISELICSYILRKSDAIEYAQEASKILDSAPGQIIIPQHNFYYSLALLASPKSSDAIISQVSQNQEKMKKWASYAPINFQHKYYLVEAEKAAKMGDITNAEKFFLRSIELAIANNYPHEAALSSEKLGEFYLKTGQNKLAENKFLYSREGYLNWNAIAKVRELEARFDFLRPQKNNKVENSNQGIVNDFLSLQIPSYQKSLSAYNIHFNSITNTIIINCSNSYDEIMLRSIERELVKLQGVKILISNEEVIEQQGKGSY